MRLDYTKGCVNFRDIGDFVNVISNKTLMKTDTLYRGGKIHFVQSANAIGNPRSIINLMKIADKPFPGIQNFHMPISNTHEVYNTDDRAVREWIIHTLRLIESNQFELPALIHCLSGKDRTGVITAAILYIIDIPIDIIIEEYLLSEGKINKELMACAIENFSKNKNYFARIKLKYFKSKLLGGALR